MTHLPTRKIIHVDMDAFFASIEQRDRPELKGKPVAVGGSSKRGVVAAASYEARKYGVRSAMPSMLALQKCPHLIFVNSRFDVYKDVSTQIRNIFYSYTDQVEPLSLDEAYLDVTLNKKEVLSAIWIAKEIKKDILKTTDLTASAGVSINKFFAKVASDIQKPNGLTVILPEKVVSFVEQLDVGKFYGVGHATLRKMQDMNIFTGSDLKPYSQLELVENFGKYGLFLYNIVRGIDLREVKAHKKRKSFSLERTFEENLKGEQSIMEKIDVLSLQLSDGLKAKDIKGKTINLKWRYGDFVTLTRSKTLNFYFNEFQTINRSARELAKDLIDDERGVRLIGMGLTKLNDEEKGGQLTLDF